jgi:hypothetical protein
MQLDNDILIELQTLSPLLAGLQKKNIFSVPNGYFDTLKDTILICLNEQEIIIPVLQTADIPTSYFDNLSSAILNKIKEQQQENIASEEALSPLLKNLQHNNIFKVPYEYFDNLATAVLGRIKELENNTTNGLKEISPQLLSIQHKNIFEVPEDYFSTVPGNILNAVKVTPAKVVSIFKVRGLLKYAAAALITGAMALGVYKYVDHPAATHISFGADVVRLSPSIEKGKNMNEQQFDDALNNLTKDDITRYLEKNGSEVDMSLLSSSLDEIDLPNNVEYLLDEKTLDNYIDKIKFQN